MISSTTSKKMYIRCFVVFVSLFWFGNSFAYVQLSQVYFSSPENLGYVNIRATRNGDITGVEEVDVIFDFGPDSEISPADIVIPANTRLSWADAEAGTKYITVQIVQDGAGNETDENLDIHLTPVGQTILGLRTKAIMSILEGTSISYTTLSSESVNENEVLTITVNRVGYNNYEQSLNVVIDYFTAEPADLGAMPAQLTWAAGEEGVKTLTIPILNDGQAENDEHFVVTLFWTGETSYLYRTPFIVIAGDVPGTINFGTIQFQTTYTIASEGSDVAINITRIGGSDGVLSANVLLGVSGDTASVQDYTEPVSLDFNWADGDDSTKTLYIPINTDQLVESLEILTLTLTSGTPEILGATVEFEVMIADPVAPGSLQLDVPVHNVDEGGEYIVNVNRIGASAGTVTAMVVIRTDGDGDTATPGLDLPVGTIVPFVWEDGDMSSRTLNVPLAGVDNIIEGPEFFTISLQEAAGTILDSVQMTINDINNRGYIEVASAIIYAQEITGEFVFTARRHGGSDGVAEVNVIFDFPGDGADSLSMEDIVIPANTNLVWAHGDMEDKSLTVQIVQDGLGNEGPNELGDISLVAVGNTVLGINTTSGIGMSEGNTSTSSTYNSMDLIEGTSFIYSLTLSGLYNAPQIFEIVVRHINTDAQDIDISETIQPLRWEIGEEGTKTFSIPVIDDGLMENPEEFWVDIVRVRDGERYILDRIMPVIRGWPLGRVQFDDVSYSASEGETITLNVSRTGGVFGALDIDIIPGLQEAGATVDLDFTLPITQLQWADGDASVRTINIPVLADELVEGVETVSLTLTAANTGTLGDPAEVIITIIDTNSPSPVIGSITVADGNRQTGAVNAELNPLVVLVVDGDGKPVDNANINWSVAPAGSVTFSNTETTQTDENGSSSNTITLLTEDSIVITATVAGYTEGGASFVLNPGLVDREGLSSEEQSVAQVLDSSCLALSALDELTAAQQDLLHSCVQLTNDPDITAELANLMPEEIQSQASAAMTAAKLQVRNVNTRLNALRRGVKGIDFSGINLKIDGKTIPGSVINMALTNAYSSNPTQSDLGIQRWGAFINANISFGKKAATSFSDGFEFDARGITAGIDYRDSSDLVMGVAVGYDSNETSYQGNAAGMDMGSTHLTFYGSWYRDTQMYVDGLFKLGWNEYDTSRVISNPGNPLQLASGSTKSVENSLSVGTGYDWSHQALSIGGYGRLSYTYVNINGYSETASNPGAPGIGSILHINNQQVDVTTATAGVELSYSISTRKAVYMPNIRLEWEHLLSESRPDIEAQFIHDPGSTTFSVGVDEKPDSDYINFGMGFSVVTTRGKSGFFYVEKRLAQDNFEQTWVKGGIRIEF